LYIAIACSGVIIFGIFAMSANGGNAAVAAGFVALGALLAPGGGPERLRAGALRGPGLLLLVAVFLAMTPSFVPDDGAAANAHETPGARFRQGERRTRVTNKASGRRVPMLQGASAASLARIA
jgi:hypothetical protein